VTAGVAINPDKSIDFFKDYLDEVDLVLVMSVYAGFGGQRFMPEVLHKVRTLVDERRRRNLNFTIEIDGGIIEETAVLCIQSGVDILVSGSYIYGSGDYSMSIDRLRSSAR
jgi:ribulose-phosphate 3-epimerase